jgi:hypothetical protein
MVERWGVGIHDRAIHFSWGNSYKIWRFPWDLEHLKCEVLRPDGTWSKAVYSWEDGEPDGRWTGTYPYHYELEDGTIQKRMATIYVERREWRWRWFMWCPLTALVRKSIDVAFDGEVGEQAGSWKGGCVGCGYNLLPGESPRECLSRMERERSFP